MSNETKKCPACAEEILAEAKKCKHCGEIVDLEIATQTTKGAPNAAIAGILSLLIPGLGQIYKGQLLNGLVWLLFVVIGYFIFIVPGIILHLLCIIGAVSGSRNSHIVSLIQQRKSNRGKVLAAVFFLILFIAIAQVNYQKYKARTDKQRATTSSKSR